jgi:hypothetical protein
MFLSSPLRRVIGYAAPFSNGDDVIGIHVLQYVHYAAGPTNLQSVGTSGVAQTEMHAQIALREVTRTGFHFSN